MSDRPLSSPATAKSSDPSLAAFVLNARQEPSAAVIATGVCCARVGGRGYALPPSNKYPYTASLQMEGHGPGDAGVACHVHMI